MIDVALLLEDINTVEVGDLVQSTFSNNIGIVKEINALGAKIILLNPGNPGFYYGEITTISTENIHLLAKKVI